MYGYCAGPKKSGRNINEVIVRRGSRINQSFIFFKISFSSLFVFLMTFQHSSHSSDLKRHQKHKQRRDKRELKISPGSTKLSHLIFCCIGLRGFAKSSREQNCLQKFVPRFLLFKSYQPGNKFIYFYHSTYKKF